MNVTIYAPDRHIVYDGSTPDTKGVGGGITARIRAAAALARQGHAVTVICNCPVNSVQDGVQYQRLGETTAIAAGVLIAHTSGGDYDLTHLTTLPIETRLRVLFLSGAYQPKSVQAFAPDFYYTPSHFLRDFAVTQWGIPAQNIFVTHHGVVNYSPADVPRDPFQLIYASHPSKGLHHAIGVLRILRNRDPRFHLEVYGGNGLWGGPDSPIDEPGVRYHGLTSQRILAAAYLRAGFAMHLQTRLEPFGLTLVESMAAGAVPVVSPVGSYAELVRDGVDGIAIPGDPADPAVRQRAVEAMIAAFPALPRLRQAATAAVITWDRMAAAWEGHWRWRLEGAGAFSEAPCAERRSFAEAAKPCAGRLLILADGLHCVSCAAYTRF